MSNTVPAKVVVKTRVALYWLATIVVVASFGMTAFVISAIMFDR